MVVKSFIQFSKHTRFAPQLSVTNDIDDFLCTSNSHI